MMEIVPVTLKEAQEFVRLHHRHNDAPVGHRFSLGLSQDGKLVGVAVVGRPVARFLDDGLTCEITRCCVLEDIRNANSMLYGAALRAAKAVGYKRAVTYTQATESGSSLKAVGFAVAGCTIGHLYGWNCKSRPREVKEISTVDKLRWEKKL